jgi:hypothetical protein
MNKVRSFQEILSIGYLYLIAIGVLSETFYYKQIGIDILEYSNILDVLISPLVRLTSSFGIIISISILIVLFFRLPNFLVKRRHKKWVQKSIKIEENLSDEVAKNTLLRAFMFFLALSLFGFFIGTGIGSGYKLAEKIENKELSHTDQIEFLDNKKINVKIVGINSAYVFYVEKDATTVKVTPVSGIVRSIENK